MPARSPQGKRLVVLRDLVGLVEVGIKVVLPRKLGLGNNRTVEGFCYPHCVLDCPPVEYWHRAGKTEADRADVGVRAVIPVIGRTAAEELALCVELAVDFETYNDIGVDHGFTACS